MPPTPSDQQPLTLTIPEVAQRLGIGRSCAYEAVRKGEIPSIRVGRRIVVPAEWVAMALQVGTYRP